MIDEGMLKRHLQGKLIGGELHCYDQIGSTNDEAFRLGVKGACEGTALIADTQSAGKGRMQRVWHSPPGANIYTSVILRPSFEVTRASQIPIAAGVAVAETLNEECPGRVALKWPNDVLIGGKKVCGILAQMKMILEAIDFIVVGIGINVNLSQEQFPEDIRDIATSLAIETGRKRAREDLIIRLYENLTKWYKTLLDRGFGPVRQAWLDHAPMIGQSVQVVFLNDVHTGRAHDLDDDGSLILLTDDHQTLKIPAGDATILKR